MSDWEGQALREGQGHPLLYGEVHSGHWHGGFSMKQACGPV